MTRYRVATLLLSIAVLALVVVFGRAVSVPLPPAAGQVRAGIPFTEIDPAPGGAVLLCISSRSGEILPPFLGQPYVSATFAPVVPLAASNQSNPPTATWGGP